MTQYDCAFGQNLVIVCLCNCIAFPYFRCKLREQYGIKVIELSIIPKAYEMTLFLQGNVFFDILACLLCGNLAQFQEFRESAIREKQFSTQTAGGKFGLDELPEVVGFFPSEFPAL